MGSAEARVVSESAELARRTGDLDVAEHYLDLAEEHARSSDDRIYQGILACRRALLERDRGNLDEARALVQTATHVAAELELPPGAELPRHIAEVRLTL
jgi:ATP/maltotriose-dependent transcriptional regulator MalT